MKVLMLNGSPKANGNTNAALLEVGRTLENEGISYEIFQMGGKPVRDCIGCGQCSEKGCAFNDDDVNEFIAKAKEADGFVFGTPVYYAHPSGRIPVSYTHLDVYKRQGLYIAIQRIKLQSQV